MAKHAHKDRIITLNNVLDELYEDYANSESKHLKRQLKKCIKKIEKLLN